MKTLQNIPTRALFAILLFAFSYTLTAQLPTYQCELKNDSLLSGKIYEFDIFIRNTGTVSFELGNFQVGLQVNPLLAGGGTVSITVVPGSSQLSAGQQPLETHFSPDENCLKVAPKSPPLFGAGSLISQDQPGTRICRLRLTNSAEFSKVQPNLAFNFTVFPYNTVVSAFDRTTQVNTEITNFSWHNTSALTNPLLNYPVFVFDVTGSGSYCEGTAGLTMTLTNSQPGVKYQLFRNGVKEGLEVNGNGLPVAWTNKQSGSYTVIGRRTATCLDTLMSDTVVIVENPLPLAAGPITGPDTVQQGQTNVSYTIPAITNATGYTWTLPSGAAITAGANTHCITVAFSPMAASGNILVTGVNACGMGLPSATLPVTVQIAAQLTLANIEVDSGEVHCYNATQTLQLAGNGTFFRVVNGASVTLIAGQNILLLAGTEADSGGYLHAYITTNAQYCLPTQQISIPADNQSVEEIAVVDEPDTMLNYILYPNPTTGEFKLFIDDHVTLENVTVHIYNLLGEEVLVNSVTGYLTGFSIGDQALGVYIIKILAGNRVYTRKIIRQ